MRANRYPFLIFDWDGTLIDSIETIVACTQETVAELGLSALPASEIRAAIGLGLRETVDQLAPGCSEQTYQEVLDTYRRLWRGGFNRRSKLFGGVEPMLATLAASGHTLAIATAKTRDGLVDDFATTGVAGHFAISRTVDESESKPHPAMVLGLLEEAGFRADQSLVIGDSIHDLAMARNAGVDAIGVTSGAQPREVLLAEGPLACLSRVIELQDWLQHPEEER